jgi:hypothetical protein
MNYSDYRVRKYWGEKQNLFNIFTIWGFGTACQGVLFYWNINSTFILSQDLRVWMSIISSLHIEYWSLWNTQCKKRLPILKISFQTRKSCVFITNHAYKLIIVTIIIVPHNFLKYLRFFKENPHLDTYITSLFNEEDGN